MGTPAAFCDALALMACGRSPFGVGSNPESRFAGQLRRKIMKTVAFIVHDVGRIAGLLAKRAAFNRKRSIVAHLRKAAAVTAALLFFTTAPAFPGSATWLAAPATGIWNSAGNWTPATVPNSAADTATFGLSATTPVSLSANTTVDGIVFNAGASAFTITASPTFMLTISGAGIVNNSASTQNFVAGVNLAAKRGQIIFSNSATAGALTAFTTNGGAASGASGGITKFTGTSTADHAAFTTNGATASGALGGLTQFFNSSTADHAVFTTTAGAVSGTGGGEVDFNNTATAANATITNNGSTVSGGGVAATIFNNTSTAGSATITNNGGAVSGALGGFTELRGSATAGSGMFINEGSAVGNANGGFTEFRGSATAANGIFTNNGGTVTDALGGSMEFHDTSTAGASMLIANGGTGGGTGGSILFFENSTGGTARVAVFGDGSLDISPHNAPGLKIGSIEGSGNVFLGAVNLTVGMNNLSTTFSGVIQDGGFTGDTGGSLTKVRSGTLILTNANTYTGNTTIADGLLQVDGSIASPNTFVNPGGTLGGTGTIFGDVFNSGAVSPGHSPGTLNIAGNYVQNWTGRLRIEIGGRDPGAFDVLAVKGSAILSGKLQLVRLNNFQLKVGDKITFLTAGGGVSGRFAVIDNPFATGTMVHAEVVYDPNAVSIEGTQGSFAKSARFLGVMPGQMSLAGALDQIAGESRFGKLFDFLNSESAGRIAHDLDLIAPEELAAIFDISNSIADLNAANITRRMDELHAGGGGGFSTTGLSLHDIHGALALDSGLPLFASTGRAVENLRASRSAGKSSKEIELAAAEEDRWGFFISGDGEFTDIKGDANASGYDLTTAGMTVGLDYKVGPNFVAGVTAGYAHTWADLVNNGRITVDGGRGGLYATWFDQGCYINGAVNGGGNSYDTHRTALNGAATGSTSGGEADALLGIGHDFHKGKWTFGPATDVEYTYTSIGGFTEQGSLAPLRIESEESNALRSRLGIRAAYTATAHDMTFSPQLRVAWQHEFLDRSHAIDAQFSSGGDGVGSVFSVHGPALGRDSMLVTGGIDVQFTQRVGTFVFYNGQLLRDRYDSHNVIGGVRVSF
jgi:uncharacterized protein with beta-barrel porin domain